MNDSVTTATNSQTPAGDPNPYLPIPVTILGITAENASGDIKTFDLGFDSEADRKRFDFVCGQFAELSITGRGESPIGIASSPLDMEKVQFTVKRYPHGQVTPVLHSMKPGDRMGLRGPFGNGFPIDELYGGNLLIIGGGFAMTTLRSLLNFALDPSNRDRFKNISLLAAARNWAEHIYKDDLRRWQDHPGVDVVLAVDRMEEGWQGKVGFAAAVLGEMNPHAEDTRVVICGPPIMLATCLEVLEKAGFPKDRILTSLERRMKCGIGKCGRCNVGPFYVCKQGPVFTAAEVSRYADL